MIGQSGWLSDTQIPEFKALQNNASADVAIIGAGITGILSAYVLAKRGLKVALIEKGKILDGATQCTTAFLTESIDTEPEQLISMFGKEKAVRIYKSHRDAIDLIEKIVIDEKIDCDFSRTSNYIYVNRADQFSDLETQCVAYHDAGVDASISALKLDGFENAGYVEIKNQAKYHPLKFLTALAQKCTELGVEIYGETEATKIDGNKILTKNGNGVSAEWIVSATYEPFGQPKGLFFKKGMYTSYILELKFEKGSLPEGTFEDTENPYHYFRVDKMEDHDHVLLGGEDHRSDIKLDPQKALDALLEYAKATFKDAKYEVVNRWDGPILEPSDGLALIGPYKNPKRLYASAFSGNGMTYAGIAAITFADIITTDKAEYVDIYSPERSMNPKALAYKAKDYAGELIQGAVKNSMRKKN